MAPEHYEPVLYTLVVVMSWWILGVNLSGTQCPNDWKFNTLDNKCFNKMPHPVKYDEACSKEISGSSPFIFTFQDKDTLNWLKRMFYQDSDTNVYWVGLDDSEMEGIYKWANGIIWKKEVWQNWNDGHPEKMNEEDTDCIQMVMMKFMEVTSCNGTKNVICEIDIDKKTKGIADTGDKMTNNSITDTRGENRTNNTGIDTDGKNDDKMDDKKDNKKNDKNDDEYPTDYYAVGSSTKTCNIQNGGCEGICIPVDGGRNCTCEDGYDSLGERCIHAVTQQMTIFVIMFLFPLIAIILILFLYSRPSKEKPKTPIKVVEEQSNVEDDDAGEEGNQDQDAGESSSSYESASDSEHK